jgi:uncharacterized delta-60 repeat protein
MRGRYGALGAFLLLALAFPAALLAQLDEAWVADYNGPHIGSASDYAYALAVDPSGNVFVAGGSGVGAPSGNDFVTFKYDANGNLLWIVQYDGPSHGYDMVRAVAADASGNVYVTGYSAGSGTGNDYATVKYDAVGNQVWVSRYNGPANGSDYPNAIAVDAVGNVYVTGYSAGSGTGNDYATVKYDANGNELWAVRYNGPANGSDQPNGIGVDASGNTVVTGSSAGSGTSYDYATVKYDAVGNQVWVSRYNGPANGSDQANAIAVDALGNICVTGNSAGSGTGADYVTVSYDPSGSQVWVARYNGSGNGSDYGRAVALGASGAVYVTGNSTGSGTGYDYVTIKYDAGGNQLWVAPYNGPGNSSDYGYDMALDGSGNICVSGYSYGSGTDYDYATVKYDAGGNQLWTARYDGPAHSYDYEQALALDASGNVYVTGYSSNPLTSTDYATVKYDATGNQLWAASYNYPVPSNDVGNKVAMDVSGNVYVTGTSTGLGAGDDFVTAKYDAGGSEQWVARYAGPGGGGDRPTDIVVDASGNVYVTGHSANLPAWPNDYDYATIKYDADGSQLWVARYNGLGKNEDRASAIALDASGNVYVTGQSQDASNHLRILTIKYGAGGDQLWIAQYSGPRNMEDYASDIAVDASGGVYVTGGSYGPGMNDFDYVTIKYDAGGNQLWAARYNGPGSGSDYAYAVAVDASGNSCVTGSSAGSGTSRDYATIKYDAIGNQLWVVRYNGPANGYDYGKALALDASGNFYVTGYSAGSGTSDDYVTIKYNPDGLEQWVARYNGPANGSDYAYGIGVDDAGNIYVTGYSAGLGTGDDYATIQYGADGHQKAVARYDGGVGGADNANSIAVAPGGTVCVTGNSAVPGENNNILTIKYMVPYGWASRAMLPTGPSDRYEGAGGWLAYNSGDQLIYAAKGENTSDFYSFNLSTNAWTELAPIPLGLENKLPHDGCRGVTDGADKVYMTKGANTLGFWSHTISTKTWTQLADVPAGRQKVKGGTDLAYAVVDRVGYVYLLKGQEREFYRYNTATNEWQRLPDAPVGNWLAGSWLAFDGDHSLYAHKALSREMYRFDVTTGAWDAAVLTGMPPGYGNLQLGTGGCATWLYGSIYALKGNNTSELWRYDLDADEWTALDDVPPDKRVHMGGDITATPDVIFAFKGSKTNELWRYVPYPELGGGGQMAGSTRLGSRYALSVAPNPMRLGAAVSYAVPTAANVSLKLYDISGALAKTVCNGRVQPGRYTTNLSAKGLARGVYILKLQSDACSLTRKVIIE